MTPSLQLSLTQRLALTPQLQQSIRLLQMSTVELEQEVERYLQENPLLQREGEEDGSVSRPAPEDGISFSEPSTPENTEETPPIQETETGDDMLYGTGSFGSPDDDDDHDIRNNLQAAPTSLREHLSGQLGLMPLPNRDRALIQYLIDALDDNGYLGLSLEELEEALPAELDVDLDELQIALKHLQHFDPVGVGARTPQECLVLQLEILPSSATQTLALRMVRDHLDLLAKREFSKLKKRLGCDDESLRHAQLLIQRLNPRPGTEYAVQETRYITPDVVVRKVQGRWIVNINAEACPRLCVNALYAQILSKHRGSTLAGHLQEARWLVKNLRQRFETILRVAQSIVERQRPFLDYGEIAMRPMIMREIAEALEMHESTISRVTTQKYMSTPRGIFEMKYFFSSHVSTETGGACSATAIRALIKQLVGGESSSDPLSDSQISEILGRQGFVVARRTVAKYRESLNIPAVKFRKSI